MIEGNMWSPLWWWSMVTLGVTKAWWWVLCVKQLILVIIGSVKIGVGSVWCLKGWGFNKVWTLMIVGSWMFWL